MYERNNPKLIMGVRKNKAYVRNISNVRFKTLHMCFWCFSVLLCFLHCSVCVDDTELKDVVTFSVDSRPNRNPVTSPPAQVTEIQGGSISNRQLRLGKEHSPYLLREDLIVESSGELVIDPDVEIRFSPLVGLLVRGVITAKGEPEARIVFTSSNEPSRRPPWSTLRLVDGPNILTGRLQLFHHGHWRSVCSNSRNWTRADLEVACRHLGFQGGAWWNWVDRQPGQKPRILLEEPNCHGVETSLLECDWESRQLGSGVCDYHPDIGIQCIAKHASSSSPSSLNIAQHWRGIQFEEAKSENALNEQNIYIRKSLSELMNVDIRYAGSGRDYAAVSAIDVMGAPPQMIGVSVLYSAYNGINITSPNAPVFLTNCTFRSNRGHGIFVNSSLGMVHTDGCTIVENGGDGIKYVSHDLVMDERLNRKDVYDFCTMPITGTQPFPLLVSIAQGRYIPSAKNCYKNFFALPGQILTVHFLGITTNKNDSGVITIHDGANEKDIIAATLKIRNGTKPQSIATTYNRVYIRYEAQPKVQIYGLLKITSGYHKYYDLNVTGSTVADNNGRGIAVEDLRSQLHVHQSSISNNNHVAGVHVIRGAGDVNVSESRIAFNEGDGINITYTGGSQNVTRTSLSSNQGYGVSVWLNDSIYDPYVALNQSTVVSYSEIFKNKEIGVFVGNFCGDAYVNITGNWFNESLQSAIEVLSCWKAGAGILHLQIGHNMFVQNKKLGIRLKPALNLEAKIEYNNFRKHVYGAILVKNALLEEYEILPANVIIENNYFENNHGVYVVNLGLSPYSELQKLIFTWNFVKDNRIREPYDGIGVGTRLIPRSQVAAPVVVSSSNVHIYRNIIQNPESKYEVGSHLQDQSKVINCTYNWLGFKTEDQIYTRVFDRKDRYNLAKVVFLPFLLHGSNPAATIIISQPTYVPQFNAPGSNLVGGEVDGIENLQAGEYIVERDINIRPGGRLTLQPGVTLRFPSGMGMMVAGYLEARGQGPNSIRFTLKEEQTELPEVDNNTVSSQPSESHIPVRLVGGRTDKEGRLQVHIGSTWGTVCNYAWDMIDAAIVCHQLGLVLNPNDWFLERSSIPPAGTSENIILSNVQCSEDDADITKCRAEQSAEFEKSCTHENDVGLRCYESTWAGVRLGVLADQSDLQFITIERAGLLDYASNVFKPALQMDLARHSLENIRVVDNLQDGLGIIYSDMYSRDVANTVKNSEFSGNRGSGISFKQLGLKISGSLLENNRVAGIRHNPAISGPQQRELAGWFKSEDSFSQQDAAYKPILIPSHFTRFDVGDQTLYLVTERFKDNHIDRDFYIKCKIGYVIGIQLLNPIHNRSTEQIIIHDSLSLSGTAQRWNLSQDLLVFPTVSSSFGIILQYRSGIDALGGAVILLSSMQAPIQSFKNRIVRGPIPTLSVTGSKIKGNKYGVWASYYNRFLNEDGDHFLRKSNESIQLINCDISHNSEEAILLNSPFWDIHHSNISEIKIMINNSLIIGNGKVIQQFNRDLRNSNNLYHWILQDNTIELNKAGGFDVSLPYVWQYNENFTHSLYLDNNTWRSNKQFSFVVDGHFAHFNMTKNIFSENTCKGGLISIQGMEKQMKITHNRIERNIGKFMVKFMADSQSEILGEVEAKFMYNEVKQNRYTPVSFRGFHQVTHIPTYVLGFQGIQKVDIHSNLFGNNSLDYELVAGIKTARIDNNVNVQENWWGSADVTVIKEKIFDFDDWNNHAVAIFRPYLMEDSFDGSLSVSWEQPSPIDLNNFGGRIKESMTLYDRDKPYIIKSDITVMPDATLSIEQGVVMEFAPNVGILVLGTLRARGRPGYEIIMRPLSSHSNSESRRTAERSVIALPQGLETVRLCSNRNCTTTSIPEIGVPAINEGFLEYYNHTTMQWVPVCDERFTERNAQVVCRELGFEPLNVYFDYGPRVEYHPNSLSRIWSWPEPLQCKGDESKMEDCAIRLNGQLYGHRHECYWNSNFVFIHCGERNLDSDQDYWGGIRFANGQFEQNLYEFRIHDVVTHQTAQKIESVLEFVNITGAGILHNEKSPAIQSINKSPVILRVNITNCASHGINLISPLDTIRLMYNSIESTLGLGISAVSLTGEGRESDESSFTPLREVHIPYNLFGLIDICDTAKEITIEERVLVYYKYDNNPVNCVKIFSSVYHSKPLGFRLLQFNLFNSTGKVGRPDSITLYDGDIYNITSRVIGHLEVGGHLEKKLFRSHLPSLSIKLFANGASGVHGFIAEIITLPISAIGFNRDVQHNISYSVLANNKEGAINYGSAGEVNPIITMEWNQFSDNCNKLYGNFTTCQAAVYLDIQNTQTLYFRNNLVRKNQGGLAIRADSRGSATSLKGWIHNNLFTDNVHNPALYAQGQQSSPYQEVIIYRNYFTRNYSPYKDVIVLKLVVSNFTYNYVHNNLGHHILEVSGYEKVRFPIYQMISHNGFYMNLATDTESRGTVVAGTAGQHYVDNVFYNPENDYEIVTVNRSFAGINSLDVWKTPIDAKHNWWSYNDTSAVMGRIRDHSDHSDLLEVDFRPFHMNNQSILSGGKCPPGWMLVGDTCYIYIGAPMTFAEARAFCRSVNASMPYVMTNYLSLYYFLRQQQQTYQIYNRVWVQHIDKINKCTIFIFQTIEIDNCESLNPFLCEIDPKVHIDPLSWRDDMLAVAVIAVVGLALLLVAIAAGCWYTKSRHRHAERLERRNSIRQSLRSVRSVGLGSSHGGFSDIGHRHKATPSQKSSPTFTKGLDYKKMMNGSIDSMDKSQFNSSIEDNQSYDIYEAHNPNASARSFNFSSEFSGTNEAVNPSFDLAYRNEGFRDTSAFTSRENWNSVPPSEYTEDSPGTADFNSSTLPLDTSLAMTDSTLEMKQGGDFENQGVFPPHLDYDTPLNDYPLPPPPLDEETYPLSPSLSTHYNFEASGANLMDTSIDNEPMLRPQSQVLLETNLDDDSVPPTRSKSEVLLETNLDFYVPAHQPSTFNRSKSQPLETSM